MEEEMDAMEVQMLEEAVTAEAEATDEAAREADEVTAALGRRMATEVLHGDIAQAQRELAELAVSSYRQRTGRVLDDELADAADPPPWRYPPVGSSKTL